MDPALPVEEALPVLDRENALVPDIRVDVESPGAVAPEGHHVFRLQVVAGQRGGDDEGFLLQRKEQLAAIGVGSCAIETDQHHVF